MATIKGWKYVLDDVISTKDIISSGCSKTLENFVPIFDADLYTKLVESGAILLEKSTVSEFATDNSYTSESATKVKNEVARFGIGNNVSGIVQLSADKENIIGYKPTYGLVSRSGIFAVASTYDTVGIYANSVSDAASVANTIKGISLEDMTNWDSSDIDLVKDIETDIKDKKLFTIKELNDKKLGKGIAEESIDQKLVDAISIVHDTVMAAEMTTTLANLTGIPFGVKVDGLTADDITINFRNLFSSYVKTKLIFGHMVLTKDYLDKYYYNMLRIRRVIFDKFNELFAKYDALVVPTSQTSVLLAVICGFPSVSIHNGITIIGKQKSDAIVLNIANILDKEGV